MRCRGGLPGRILSFFKAGLNLWITPNSTLHGVARPSSVVQVTLIWAHACFLLIPITSTLSPCSVLAHTTDNYLVPAHFKDIFETIALDHDVDIPPVFLANGKLVCPSELAVRLLNALVKVMFTLRHCYITDNNKKANASRFLGKQGNSNTFLHCDFQESQNLQLKNLPQEGCNEEDGLPQKTANCTWKKEGHRRRQCEQKTLEKSQHFRHRLVHVPHASCPCKHFWLIQ